MLIQEKFVVKAPPDEVWAFLMNADRSGPCVPGCEKVDVLDDRTYLVKVKVKIAFVSLAFSIKVQVTGMNPPFHLETVATGEESSLTSTLKAKSVVDIRALRIGGGPARADVSIEPLNPCDEEPFRQLTESGPAGCGESGCMLETEISYRSEVSLFGKLGTMGQGVVKGKARQIGRAFAEAVRSRLEAKGAGTGPSSIGGAAAGSEAQDLELSSKGV